MFWNKPEAKEWDLDFTSTANSGVKLLQMWSKLHSVVMLIKFLSSGIKRMEKEYSKSKGLNVFWSVAPVNFYLYWMHSFITWV